MFCAKCSSGVFHLCDTRCAIAVRWTVNLLNEITVQLRASRWKRSLTCFLLSWVIFTSGTAQHFTTENRTGLKWKPRCSKIPRCVTAHVDPTLAAHHVATESLEVHGFIMIHTTIADSCSYFSWSLLISFAKQMPKTIPSLIAWLPWPRRFRRRHCPNWQPNSRSWRSVTLIWTLQNLSPRAAQDLPGLISHHWSICSAWLLCSFGLAEIFIPFVFETASFTRLLPHSGDTGDTRTLGVYAASSSPSNFASKWHSSFVTFPWDGEDKWHSVCNLPSKVPCGTIPSRKISTVKSSESYDVSDCVGIFQEGPFNSLQFQSIGCGLSAATSGSSLSELLEETFDEPLRQCDRCVRQWRALWAWVICVPKESADMYMYIYIYIHPYIHTYIHYIHTYIHYITFHSIPLHYITYIHYIHTLHTYIHTLHYITLHSIPFHYITLHYVHTLHTYIHTSHYITLHYIRLHYITYIHTYIQTHIYIYVYIYIYRHIYIDIHIQKSWSQYGRTKVQGGNAKASMTMSHCPSWLCLRLSL